MLRRTPLKPGKPLERRTPLAQVSTKKLAAAADLPPELRRKALKPSLKTTYRPAVPQEVRAEVTVRSGGWCEAQLVACLGRATEVHHRITQKAGGRKGAAKAKHDRLANTMHLCHICHAWVTQRPTEAGELGLALKEFQVPAQEPVLYRGEMVYLDDFGGVHPYEDVSA